MYSESYRPKILDEVIGHVEIKKKIEEYLKSDFKKTIFLVGCPGIGKTTLALCGANTFGFDPLEINASRSIRSFEDVDILRTSCMGSVNIQSFVLGQIDRKTCIILDEVDGSDPHAQTKIIDWVKDPKRCIPIICTGNEVPTIFKRNTDYINILRCVPPTAEDVRVLFNNVDVPLILKECQNDIRRMFHRLQYGISYAIPKYILPPTGTSPEKTFIEKQKMFGLEDPLYRDDKLGKLCSHETINEYKNCDKRVHTQEVDIRQTKFLLDKSHTVVVNL